MLWRDFFGNGFNGSSRRSIWREMDRMQREMSRLMGRSRLAAAPAFPATNIWSGQDGAMITAEVPGVEPDDLDISIVNDTITLSGSRNMVELAEGERFHRRERGYGQFNRTLQLPFRIDPDNVQATFRNGTLYISVPRAEEDRPRKITVKG